MAKVKVGMYQANRWSDDYPQGEIISKEEFEKLKASKAINRVADDDSFEVYLSRKYSLVEVFEMSKSEKERVEQEYKNACEEDIESEMSEQWNYIEIETEIEIPTAEIVVCGCPLKK
jgi:hypothetical protein